MRTIRHWFIGFAFLAAALLPLAPAAAAAEYLVYIGTYTGAEGKGIQGFRFDTASGKLAPLGVVAETPNPSFLTIHPNRRFLYSVSELNTSDGQKGGAISAFSIDTSSGKLTFLNKVSSRGAGPCHVSVDRTGKSLVAANYGGGSVASFPIHEDGRLGEAASFIQHTGSGADPKRQRGPHAHSMNFSPENRFAVAADLGLDQVLVYRFDPVKSSLAPNEPPFAKVEPGSGPRHFAFHPAGKFAYVINEMASTVTAFSWDGKAGALKELQTITTLPKDFSGNNSTAEVQVHPTGKWLYGSNRGHDSISVFAVDTRKGTLTPIEQTSTQGRTPRNFGIDPSGSYLIAANQSSHNLVVFRIDPKTGRLTPTGETAEVRSPVCVRFMRLN
jgi:6-phosphogluconolactonase